jgi:hypothetical protein
MASETLDLLPPEERHRLFRMLRLMVLINPDRSSEVIGALATEPVQSKFVQPETVLGQQLDNDTGRCAEQMLQRETVIERVRPEGGE